MYLSLFLFVQVGSISSYILTQFEFHVDFEFIRLCMLPSICDMTSVGFRRSSFAVLKGWEVISDLGVAYIGNGMRRPYVSLEEPSVGPLGQTSVSLTMSFFSRAYVRRICSFSRTYCTICLSQILRRSGSALCLP